MLHLLRVFLRVLKLNKEGIFSYCPNHELVMFWGLEPESEGLGFRLPNEKP